ncbi:cancer-related nucleoside-triphosphatase homolog [Limulus polyphemus]|uniref:Cancer-related nucleoside-triphosphatase homolog n=1 Tax=Limulus polyphemus TaxID=6850 RepID=A0ABM1BLZ6_LIMPO|nr:cancer-related nucleoside-triphosphatase homolog [Limulus polyphemus]
MAGKHILLTGIPGIGKTTIVQRVCENLKKSGLLPQGFYTEEVRQGGRRIGFDVVCLNGERGPLARVSDFVCDSVVKGPKVGQYVVELSSFEKLALPALQSRQQGCSVIILDEIGKMEMYSEHFKQAVRASFNLNGVSILATIPVAKGKPLPLVEELRNRKDVTIITVTRDNRESLVQEVTCLLLSTA